MNHEQTDDDDHGVESATGFAERREIVDVEEAKVQVVIFSLSGEAYAFPGREVREILPLGEVAWAPGLPPFILGLVSVRGDIESVTDIRPFLHLPPADSRQGYIVLAEHGLIRTGIVVDEVLDVVDVPVSAISSPLATLVEDLRGFVSGVMTFNGREITLLDASNLLSRIEI